MALVKHRATHLLSRVWNNNDARLQEYTRKKISDFLHSHTAYELIPESGKIVVLDADLPVRQAFHALHEQVSLSAGCAVQSLRRFGHINTMHEVGRSWC